MRKILWFCHKCESWGLVESSESFDQPTTADILVAMDKGHHMNNPQCGNWQPYSADGTHREPNFISSNSLDSRFAIGHLLEIISKYKQADPKVFDIVPTQKTTNS